MCFKLMCFKLMCFKIMCFIRTIKDAGYLYPKLDKNDNDNNMRDAGYLC